MFDDLMSRISSTIRLLDVCSSSISDLEEFGQKLRETTAVTEEEAQSNKDAV